MTSARNKKQVIKIFLITVSVFCLMAAILAGYNAAYKVYINYLTRQQFSDTEEAKDSLNEVLIQPDNNKIMKVLGCGLNMQVNSDTMRCYNLADTEGVLIFSRVSKNLESDEVQAEIDSYFSSDGTNNPNGCREDVKDLNSDVFTKVYKYKTASEQTMLIGYCYKPHDKYLYSFTFSAYPATYSKYEAGIKTLISEFDFKEVTE